MSVNADAEKITDRFSAWILPCVLAVLAYFAQSNYQEMRSQLNRIESRQTADIVTITELRFRILTLEQWTASRENRQPPQQRKDASGT